MLSEVTHCCWSLFLYMRLELFSLHLQASLVSLAPNLVPKQPHFSEGKLAPEHAKTNWTHPFRDPFLGPNQPFSFYSGSDTILVHQRQPLPLLSVDIKVEAPWKSRVLPRREPHFLTWNSDQCFSQLR